MATTRCTRDSYWVMTLLKKKKKNKSQEQFLQQSTQNVFDKLTTTVGYTIEISCLGFGRTTNCRMLMMISLPSSSFGERERERRKATKKYCPFLVVYII